MFGEKKLGHCKNSIYSRQMVSFEKDDINRVRGAHDETPSVEQTFCSGC